MAVYAQVSDIENRLGESIPDDAVPQAETLLDDAEAVLTAMVGDLAARILAGRTTADNIARVAASMVVRVLRNPNGLRQENYPEYSFVRDTQISAGGLVLTREDRRLLGLRSGAVSVPVGDTALRDVLRHPRGGTLRTAAPASPPAPMTVVRETAVAALHEPDPDGSVVVTQSPVTGTVTKVEYVPTAAMTGAVTNNRTVSLINKGQDGASTTVVATLIFAAGVTAAASNEILIPLTVNTAVVEGDTLLWRSVHNGGGIADPGGLVRITFTQ